MKTWIGGYPKSGTTWVKFIVVALLYRTNNAKKVEKYIPNIENPRKVKKDGYYKTHVVIPPKGRLLYVVRHPVDVCVSGANFVALSAGKVNYSKYVDEFIAKRGNTIRNFGTWDDSIANWINAGSYWFKYEDLLKDTPLVVAGIADYIGAPLSNREYAVEQTSFAIMRAMEKKAVAKHKHNVPDVFYNPKSKGYKYGLMFVNKGKYGYAHEYLSDNEINRICDAFAKGIKRVGYGPY